MIYLRPGGVLSHPRRCCHHHGRFHYGPSIITRLHNIQRKQRTLVKLDKDLFLYSANKAPGMCDWKPFVAKALQQNRTDVALKLDKRTDGNWLGSVNGKARSPSSLSSLML